MSLGLSAQLIWPAVVILHKLGRYQRSWQAGDKRVEVSIPREYHRMSICRFNLCEPGNYAKKKRRIAENRACKKSLFASESNGKLTIVNWQSDKQILTQAESHRYSTLLRDFRGTYPQLYRSRKEECVITQRVVRGACNVVTCLAAHPRACVKIIAARGGLGKAVPRERESALGKNSRDTHVCISR